MILKSIKIVDKEGRVTSEQDFVFAHQRSTWLRQQGFIHAGGTYYHIDGRRAGLFDKKVGDNGSGSPVSQHIYDVCTNPLTKTRSVWDILLRGSDAR